ncbi:unnamed protein product [Caenorhabditis nigoni]
MMSVFSVLTDILLRRMQHPTAAAGRSVGVSVVCLLEGLALDAHTTRLFAAPPARQGEECAQPAFPRPTRHPTTLSTSLLLLLMAAHIRCAFIDVDVVILFLAAAASTTTNGFCLFAT